MISDYHIDSTDLEYVVCHIIVKLKTKFKMSQRT